MNISQSFPQNSLNNTAAKVDGRFLRVFAMLLLTFALLFMLAGCSENSATTSSASVSDDTKILDVRTPEEYAAGHLEGSKLLDLNSGEFEDSLPDLDPEATYIVYCRSGSRSAQAVAMMEDAGFTNVTDLGSMENAAETTGISIVS